MINQLIEKGTQDARERAEKIVLTAKGKLGKLKDASMGVFQITGKGSIEEDRYGGNLIRIVNLKRQELLFA